MSFVHLHVHSEYSMLDGLGHVKLLAQRARELGMPALALTDHGVMYGAIEFFDACKDAGVKPIIGIETYLCKRGRRMQDKDANVDRSPHHLLLLAQDNEGYSNLMHLASLSQIEGFYYKPRIDHDSLAKYSAGVICTSGCPSSEIPRLILGGQPEKAREAIQWYRDVFGDRFYLELQEHDLQELAPITPTLVGWSCELGIPLVATNDVHYVRREDAKAQDLMLCIQTNTLYKDAKRMRMNNDSYYLKSEEEMQAIFDPIAPEAITNTAQLAERCSVSLKTKQFHLPNFKRPEQFPSDPDYLRQLCAEGFLERYGIPFEPVEGESDEPIDLSLRSSLALPGSAGNPNLRPSALRQRLNYELGVIIEMGFAAYFLIVWDLIRFARENNIWWNVRGSAAGSVVSHVLDLTNIEPVSNDLLFERFLNPGRVTMPDIDMDFPDDQRNRLVDYTIAKYGKEQVAQIITFGTMAARASLKDVGRVLDLPLGEVSRMTSLVPAIPGKPVGLKEALEQVPDLKKIYDGEEHLRDLYDKAIMVEGTVRNAGTHAAGVVIADKPLIEYVPLHRLTGTPLSDQLNAITQFEMTHLESIGLLKMDYLGLSMLTIMRKACELIKKRHGVDLMLNTIPIHDPVIYLMLSRGDVLGVFQVEGSGMKNLMMQMKPTRFENIVAAVALFRPGPMEQIPTYIRRMHDEEPTIYRHADLEPALEETYGICVSGDALLFDPLTGKRCRLDQAQGVDNLHLQGVADDLSPAVGRVTHWIYSGKKPVYRLTLRTGANIKVTANHHLLTEQGWKPLSDLHVGDYIATPTVLLGPDQTYSRERLRILAYLISDGDLGNLAAVNFVSKDEGLLNEYRRCVSSFPNLGTGVIEQVRGVKRITIAKAVGGIYHEPNSLLRWLRELGLKHIAGSQVGGCRSHEKFVPEFVFELGQDDIAYFLASIWDCDGFMGRKTCHYKTISRRLAEDVHTLLLRLGIRSTIYESRYETAGRNGSGPQDRHAYQVTVFDTARLAQHLQPYMLTDKRLVICIGEDAPTIGREAFIAELDATTNLSRRALMAQHGISSQHFQPRGRRRSRISVRVVEPVVRSLPLEETRQHLHVYWEEIARIEPAGVEDVYDLTVDGLHNFIANNIVVHNCVYQEQIMRVARDIAGYSVGEADTIRKAVSKKNAEALMKHKTKFREGAVTKGYAAELADDIFADIEFFARYGFCKAHAADYAQITCQTAYLKARYTIEYMTALMTCEAGNTEKIAALIADVKGHGIEILPPSINHSLADFSIEDHSVQGASAVRMVGKIRFGLMAIKNVGLGPIEAIVKAREIGGAFKSLDDFCRRVDMTQVNKRALESLIKVGALDEFGPRHQLLAIIDQMVGVASQARKAAERGQFMLFDTMGAGGDDTFIMLPTNVKEIPRKELLNFERELTGTYVSEHPLTAVMATLREHITHTTAELSAGDHAQKVVLAGVITMVRQHVSKTGKSMAFAELEDMYGRIELTIFPRTWDEYQDKLQRDKVVVVWGKAEVREGNAPKLLVERVSDSLVRATSTDARPAYAAEPGDRQPAAASAGQVAGIQRARPAAGPAAPQPNVRESPAVDYDVPPEPEFPPYDLVYDGEPPEDNSNERVPAGRMNDVAIPAQANAAPATTKAVLMPSPVANIEQPGAPAMEEAPVASQGLPASARDNGMVVTDAPVPPAAAGDRSGSRPAESRVTNDPVQVVIRRCGDVNQDVARLEAVHQTLVQFKGQQRFTICLRNNGRQDVTLDFPNDMTRDCPELRTKLTALGADLRHPWGR